MSARVSALLVAFSLFAIFSNDIRAQGKEIPSITGLVARAEDVMDRARTAPKGATGSVDQVLAELEATLTKFPQNALLQMAMGRALLTRDCMIYRIQCSIRAKDHLLRAVQLNPNLVRAHVLLAHDALNTACLACADTHLAAATTAISTMPPQPDAFPYLQEVRGRRLDIAGGSRDAVRLYMEALKGFPTPMKKWQVLCLLSDAYLKAGDLDRAEEFLKQAHAAAPDGAWSNDNLGEFYIHSRGDSDRAIPLLQKTLSIISYGPAREALSLALYEKWGDAYLAKKDKAQTAALWKEAQANSTDVAGVFGSSVTFAATGKAARALLLQRSVSPQLLNQPISGKRLPLVAAIINENSSLAALLIQNGANINVSEQGGLSVLQTAAVKGDITVLSALASRKANFKVIDERSKDTLLSMMARYGGAKDSAKTAAFLIAQGVPVNAKSAAGEDALMLAAERTNTALVRYLLAHGANPANSTYMNLPNIAWPIQNGGRDVVEAMLDKIPVSTMKIGDMTLEQYAKSMHQEQIAELIRNYGAKGNSR